MYGSIQICFAIRSVKLCSDLYSLVKLQILRVKLLELKETRLARSPVNYQNERV
jgi:hypothetical protein